MYDEAVTEGPVVLWEASDRVCGKRLWRCPPSSECFALEQLSSP